MAAAVAILLMFLFLPMARQDSTQHSLAAVLRAFEKLLQFYQGDYEGLNIDGLYGVRVMEGHTAAIVEEYMNQQLPHLSEDVISRIKTINTEASAICEKAKHHVKKDNEQYYQQMSFVIASPWAIFTQQRREVDMDLRWGPEVYAGLKVKLTESLSDRCMSELIGTSRSDGARCQISSKCLELMTEQGMVGYGITHQILWTMMTEKAGCTDTVEQLLREHYGFTLSHVRSSLCSNNYIQMKKTLAGFHNKKILPRFQDLFLEQLFACPSLGFHDFLSLEYLPQIISWQFKNGCYGMMHRPSKEDFIGVRLHYKGGDPDYDYLDDDEDKVQSVKEFVQAVRIADDPSNNKVGDDIQQQGVILKDDVVIPKANVKLSSNTNLHTDTGIHTVDNSAGSRKDYSHLKPTKNVNQDRKAPTGSDKDKVKHSPEGGQRKLLSVEHIDWDKVHFNKGRKLLVEKVMNGGCLSHKTAVAAGALSLYLRYLCSPDAASIFNKTGGFGSVEVYEKPPQRKISQNDRKDDVRLQPINKHLDAGAKFIVNPHLDQQEEIHGNVFPHQMDGGRHGLDPAGLLQDTGNSHLANDNMYNHILQPHPLGKQANQILPPLHPAQGADGDENYDVQQYNEGDYKDDDDDNDDDGDNNYEDDDDEEDNGNYYTDTALPAGNLPKQQGLSVNKNNKNNNNNRRVLYPDHRDNGIIDKRDDDDNYDVDDGEENGDGDGDYNEEDGNQYADAHKSDGKDDNVNVDDRHGDTDTVKGSDFDKYVDDTNDGHDRKNKKGESQQADYSYYDDYKGKQDDKKDAVRQDNRLSEDKLYRHQPLVTMKKESGISTKGSIVIFVVCFVLVLLLMYRFIRKRRIHIRYNPRKSFGV